MLRGAHLPYHGPRTVAPNGKHVYPPEGLRAVPLHPITTSLHTTPSRSSLVLSSPNSATCPSPDQSVELSMDYRFYLPGGVT